MPGTVADLAEEAWLELKKVKLLGMHVRAIAKWIRGVPSKKESDLMSVRSSARDDHHPPPFDDDGLCHPALWFPAAKAWGRAVLAAASGSAIHGAPGRAGTFLSHRTGPLLE